MKLNFTTNKKHQLHVDKKHNGKSFCIFGRIPTERKKNQLPKPGT